VWTSRSGFSPSTPVYSTNKTDRHVITEILLKITLTTIIVLLRLFINNWIKIEDANIFVHRMVPYNIKHAKEDGKVHPFNKLTKRRWGNICSIDNFAYHHFLFFNLFSFLRLVLVIIRIKSYIISNTKSIFKVHAVSIYFSTLKRVITQHGILTDLYYIGVIIRLHRWFQFANCILRDRRYQGNVNSTYSSDFHMSTCRIVIRYNIFIAVT
jgi:hypothetical protein